MIKRFALLKNRTGDREEGFALVAVMGIIALLTVITVGGFSLAQQTLHEAERTKSEALAFQAASGAMDAATARVGLTGYKAADFPMVFTAAELRSGSATVTATETVPGDIRFTSVGLARDGSRETVRVRMFVMDIYGMNIAYGSGFNQNSSGAGKFNGNASIYGPFYTYEDLRQGDNLGNAMSGGLGWGPVYIKSGTLDVKSGYLVDVGLLYVDPAQPDPKVVTAPTKVIRSVPKINIPRVDTAFLTRAYANAVTESSDNNEGDPVVRSVPNSEVTSTGNPATYTGTRAPGASTSYKVIDNDGTMNKSLAAGFTLSPTTSFGKPNDDFVWNHSTKVLTVWGTVFIDGPLTIPATVGAVTYVGNGSLVANGEVTIDGDFTPVGGLLPGVCGDGVTRNNQSFDPGRIVGIVSPSRIRLAGSSGGNSKNPDGVPTHAGAYFADEGIVISAKVHLVGSLISKGIDVEGNNNMDLRTSPNLGQNVPKSMPGYGNLSQSLAIWTRQ